jgi:DNA mismatch endonuclease, patch repair protein
MDVHTPEERSRNMAAIKGKNTKPEMLVRRLVHAAGYRYRLHRRNLPGCPDLVFPSRRSAIFVHGCFWHCHDCKYGQVHPETNARFWDEKRTGNVSRDTKNRAELEKSGWRVLVVWECQTRDETDLRRTLLNFLED